MIRKKFSWNINFASKLFRKSFNQDWYWLMPYFQHKTFTTIFESPNKYLQNNIYLSVLMTLSNWMNKSLPPLLCYIPPWYNYSKMTVIAFSLAIAAYMCRHQITLYHYWKSIWVANTIQPISFTKHCFCITKYQSYLNKHSQLKQSYMLSYI